jgi:hypothetical protein
VQPDSMQSPLLQRRRVRLLQVVGLPQWRRAPWGWAAA